MKFKLDNIDLQILKLLQENSQMTMKHIGQELGLSTTPIFERIKRMEKSGVIKKYVALVDSKLINKKLMVLIDITLKDHSKTALKRFQDHMMALEEVMECFHVTGDSDYVLKVAIEDMESYQKFVVGHVSEIPNVDRIKTRFALEVTKSTTAYKINDSSLT